MSAALEAMLTDDFPADLPGLAIDDLRAMRTRLKAVEDGLSYLRRMIQGRLDVVAAEQSRRSDGAEANIEELMARLPGLLATSTRSAGPGARPPQRLTPGEVDPELADDLDEIISHGRLLDVSSLADEELWAAESELTELERTVSGYRKRIFTRLDELDGEITRRYRTGEQNVNDLFA